MSEKAFFNCLNEEWPILDNVRRFYEYQAIAQSKFHNCTYRWEDDSIVFEYPSHEAEEKVGETIQSLKRNEKWAFLLGTGLLEKNQIPDGEPVNQRFLKTTRRKICATKVHHLVENNGEGLKNAINQVSNEHELDKTEIENSYKNLKRPGNPSPRNI